MSKHELAALAMIIATAYGTIEKAEITGLNKAGAKACVDMRKWS